MLLAARRIGYRMLAMGLLAIVSFEVTSLTVVSAQDREHDSSRRGMVQARDVLDTSNRDDSRIALTPSPLSPNQGIRDSQDTQFVSEKNELAACDCPVCRAATSPGTVTGCKTCCRGELIDWAKYPATIHPMPRLGFFPIPPTQGQAYYSLWDRLEGVERPSAPKSGYAATGLNSWSYFDADWRYVETIDPADRTRVEQMKRMHLNDCLMLSVGGGYWVRFMNEHNSRLTRTTNDYTLDRFRLYTDWWYGDSLRVYGEYLWADAFAEDLTPLPLDANRGDILNLFVDLKLFDYEGKPVFVRGGRQEMLYGSQRLISTLEWANTRRTFEGVKLFRQGEHWDVDAFWVQPVIPRADKFDATDENQNLIGGWATYRPKKGEFIDFYYLGLNNSNTITQSGIERSPAHIHTTGTRWVGDQDGYLWDVEAMMQFGEQTHRDLFAGAATAGIGRNWKDACWTPTFWAYYDYASGDNNPNSGDAHTFHQLYPFGHYYLGWMDLVGRQNIHDVNLHCYLYPTPWITFWAQYHHFWLDQSRDALYSPAGTVLRRDPTGAAGNDVGDEVGLFTNFHLARYSDIMVSYNKLYGGGFLQATAGPTGSANAESLYLMFQQRW